MKQRKIINSKRLLFLVLLLIPWSSYAQEKVEVVGAVTDSLNRPLQGVNIFVKNKPSIATFSDHSGRFIFDVNTGDVLVFSLIGYIPQEYPVYSNERISIQLESSTDKIEEVVVVAFGNQKKTELVSAVTSINPSELKVPSSNLTTALAGRIAGVIAYQRSGEPGLDNAEFFIRGVTTFGYKKDPLILIDGVEFGTTELARLQPDDIASFSIMKDASATALYGARGANGVILVTTKIGRVEKAKINFRYENSLSQATRNIELANPTQYMKLENEAVLTRGRLDVPYSERKIDNTFLGSNSLIYPATDWMSELVKNSVHNQRYNMNLTGGGSVAQYYIAGTFNKDNGMLKVDPKNNFNNNIDLRSYSLRSNVNINITNTTQAGVKLYGSFDDYTGPISGGAEVYRMVMRTNPVMFPAYYPIDEDHKHTKHIMFGGTSSGNSLNPYAELMKGYKDYTKSLMMAQFEIKHSMQYLTEGLSLRAMVNTNRFSEFDVSRFYKPFYYELNSFDRFTGEYTVDVINPNKGTEYLDYAEGPKIVQTNLYAETAINYNRTFNDVHGLSGLLIYTMRNYLEGNAGSLLLSLPYRNQGISGRATYSYDRRYFTEFNFGYNGSERFYKNNRFGFFPSGGVAWSIADEPFLKNFKSTLSKLKLRATYGIVGNDAIGGPSDRFFYLSTVDMNNSSRGGLFGTNINYGKEGVLVSRYDNKMITWETAHKTNFGLEIGLWDKLDFQIDYFTEYRKNILMDRASIPTTMGLTAPIRANVGEASGKGVDMSLDYSKNFSNGLWIVGRGNFTYATSRYEVIEEPEYKEKNLSKIGFSLSQPFGLIAERLFVDEADVKNSPYQNFGLYEAGDIKYRDLNGDGQITNLDIAPIGYPTTPEIIYGFGFSAGYKGFDLSCFFQGSGYSSFWMNEKGSTSPFVGGNQLLATYEQSYWSEESRDIYAILPRLSRSVNENNSQTSTWFMRDGRFLRLKSLELGYSLPKSVLNNIKVGNLRLYASGTNLFLWSKFMTWDVEMGSQGLGYPLQRVMNFGLQLSF